jgi:UDP-N-acetylmuramoyl-L-alanyl-D-glutamate--2,6-diaminopimelate ligase
MGDLHAAIGGTARVELVGDPLVVVFDATHDSRAVQTGWLYLAVPGARFNGHDFIDAAIENGATGLCVSQRVRSDLPILLVNDTRLVMPVLAAEVHNRPSTRTRVIGVTGTNGKTTVTFMIDAILGAAGRRCGLIGTVLTRVGERLIPNPRTTPEATDFQRLLATMADDGASFVACEVSSHALALGRVDETNFEVGAFTNLSQDHLDFHGGIEEYFETKARLLERAHERVIWVEDAFGARLANRYRGALMVGWEQPVRASQMAPDATGTSFTLTLPDGSAPSRINLPGRFNVANALVAAACAHLVGLRIDEIAQGLESLASVPGRFEAVSDETVSGANPVSVIVDYAHTPDGIATVIETARTLTRGRVIVVIGAGGDRDRNKRPQMGRAASQADMVVVTSDNPRSEDPDEIIAQVVSGVDNPAVIKVTDRRQAIRGALAAAHPGDMVLVLGKGHETGQEVSGVVFPFDDRQVIREELAAREQEP